MLTKTIAMLTAKVEELERRLGRSSRNSSKPPSSDPPGAPSAPQQKLSGRKPGGQPGHKGSRRELLPPEEVDRIEDCWPDTCGSCQGSLPERWRREIGKPLRQQVTELPPVTPTTTEYRLHGQRCPGCGATTEAKLPDDVSLSAFGPRVTALVAILTGCYRLSKRMAMSVMKDLFGVELALGSVTTCEQTVSETVAVPVREAHEFVQRQNVVHADETSWRERRKRAWLWVAATATVTVFRICGQRGKDAAKALLGAFRGTLVTDRYNGYLWYGGLRQLCWAHLLRDFRDMSERKGSAGRTGHALVRNTKTMFKWWHRVRDGTLTRRGFRQKMAPLRLDFERLLKHGQRGGTSISGSCSEMLKLFDAFFTFVDHEGIEPTNNFAERQIRHAVLWRKPSFGTHSAAGSRFVERMLTVRATLRQQGRNIVDYVVQAQQSALRGQTIESLMSPTSDLVRAAA